MLIMRHVRLYSGGDSQICFQRIGRNRNLLEKVADYYILFEVTITCITTNMEFSIMIFSVLMNVICTLGL